MQISACAAEDRGTIFDLYDAAVEFQKTKSLKHWQKFDQALIETEISEKRLLKILEGETVACIFTIAHSDPLIWGESSNEQPALYIHRIVTNPSFRGRGYVNQITLWAKEYCTARQKKYIRLDTWADNQKLNDYYLGCGYTFIKTVTPEASGKLPKHYDCISLSLFEIRIA